MAKCKECKGSGVVDYLVSMHDDVTETSTCYRCGGKGSINYMSDEDEADYHADYW